MTHPGVLYLWSLRRPDVPPFRGTPLPDRCPVVQCPRVCKYEQPSRQTRVKVPPYKLPNGTLIVEHVTAAGDVDGRCLTKAAARQRIKEMFAGQILALQLRDP